MRVHDIGIYRDGGSIEFSITAECGEYHVWLETKDAGVPRRLLINSIAVLPSDPLVQRVLALVDRWWDALDAVERDAIGESMCRSKPIYNPTDEMTRAIDLGRVAFVRNYMKAFYTTGPVDYPFYL